MKTKTAKPVKSRLALAREEAGYTQAAFAEALNASQQSVSEWERGRYPRDVVKVRIAKLLRADPYELFPLEDIAS